MARNTPTSGQERQAFLRKLSPPQRAAFDGLAATLATPGADLGRYHAIGGLIERMLPAERTERGRVLWMREPAEALGCSHTTLQKALRFRQEYPRPKDVRKLQAQGVGWTLVCIAFAVRDPGERHDLLAEAGREGWTPEQMRFEVQRRHPTRRHGIGGRPRRKLRGHGPEVTLRELGRLSRRWLDFHDAVWLKVKEKEWRRLVREWPGGDRAKLRELVEKTQEDLGRMEASCKEIHDTLADLKQGL
jgi:hypothetical protein